MIIYNKVLIYLTELLRQRHLRVIGMLLLLLSISGSAGAQTETDKEKGKESAKSLEEISLKQRFGFRTNAVDWLLTIPNVSVEFDLGNTIRSKRTISMGFKYNWETQHKVSPSTVFNIFDARVEWRQYFRTRRRGYVTDNPGLMTRLKERVFTTKRANPRVERAYFWGIYAHASSYSLKIGKEGKQGTAYGAGLSLGYTAPLYGYRNGALDFEMGGSIGLLYNSYDVYTHDAESNTYGFDPAKSKGGHLTPFPAITDLRVAFVYRFMSVSDKYKASIERRIDRVLDKRNAANQAIQSMRMRIDSIDIAVRKQGGTGPDSLLNKAELKQWELMKKERKEKQLQEQEEALRKEAAASLGITLSDTLDSKQEKAIREEMEKRKKAAEEAAKPVDPKKAEKKAEKERKKAEKENKDAEKEEQEDKKDKKDKKEKKDKEKKSKKEKKKDKEAEETKEGEAEAKETEQVAATEKEEEGEP